jgi:hypothetical protein
LPGVRLIGPSGAALDRLLGELGHLPQRLDGGGRLPAAYFLADPSWFPGRSRAAWQEITRAGLGKPEPLADGGGAAAREPKAPLSLL